MSSQLEKKFSDRHVVFIAQRRMMRKPTRGSRQKQQRPRSRTLKAVHDAILEDLVFPTVRPLSLTRLPDFVSSPYRRPIPPFLSLPSFVSPSFSPPRTHAHLHPSRPARTLRGGQEPYEVGEARRMNA